MVNFVKKIAYLLAASSTAPSNNLRSAENDCRNISHFTSVPNLNNQPKSYNIKRMDDFNSASLENIQSPILPSKRGSNIQINQLLQSRETSEAFSLNILTNSNPSEPKFRHYGGFIVPSREQKDFKLKKFNKIFIKKKHGKMNFQSNFSVGCENNSGGNELLLNNRKSTGDQKSSEDCNEFVFQSEGQTAVEVIKDHDFLQNLTCPEGNISQKEPSFDLQTLKSATSDNSLSLSKSSDDLCSSSDSSDFLDKNQNNFYYLSNINSLNELIDEMCNSKFSIDSINLLEQKILSFELTSFITQKLFNSDLVKSLKLLKYLYLLKEIAQATVSQDQSLVLFSIKAKRNCLMNLKRSFTDKFARHSRSKAIKVYYGILDQFNWDTIVFNFTHANNYEIVLDFFKKIKN